MMIEDSHERRRQAEITQHHRSHCPVAAVDAGIHDPDARQRPSRGNRYRYRLTASCVETTVVLVKTRVFFYGTTMNPEAMKGFGVTVADAWPAKLPGFELVIRPRPNLVPSDRGVVFGSLMAVTHEDLTTLYSGLEKSFGIKYLPEAVLVVGRDGFLVPALCYVVPRLPDAAPDPAFIKQLAYCVRLMGHPEWYAAHVESFGAPVTGE